MKVLILASGGYDSVTLMHLAKHLNYDVELIFFDYGQHSLEAEKFALEKNMGVLGIYDLTIVPMSIPWTKSNVVGDVKNPVAYIESRNVIMLSLAMSYAESKGIDLIFIGLDGGSPDYPDCQPEFIRDFNNMSLGLTGIRVEAPLNFMSKAQILELGSKLGVIYYNSCSNPSPDRFQPCNECSKCLDDIKARAILKAK